MEEHDAENPRAIEVAKELEIEKLNNDHNNYATSKSNSQNLINSSLVISLINTMIGIIATGNFNGWKTATIVFICLSIGIQVVMFAMLVTLAKANTEKIGRSCTATRINTWVTILSGLLPIVSATILALDQVSTFTSTNYEIISIKC